MKSRHMSKREWRDRYISYADDLQNEHGSWFTR